MAQHISTRTVALIPADLSEPIPTFSWPEWLRRSAKALGLGFTTEIEDGRKVKRGIPTIPREFLPSPVQIREVERRIEDLRAIDSLRDLDLSMTAVASLLLAKPSAALSDAGAEARSQAYMVSLGDLPTFAVREAVRKWLRAEVRVVNGHPVNFEFAPSGEQLRIIALSIADRAQSDIALLERLLVAQVVDEPAGSREVPVADEDALKNLKSLSAYLASAPDPVPPRVRGNARTGTAGGHAARVMAELERRRAAES